MAYWLFTEKVCLPLLEEGNDFQLEHAWELPGGLVNIQLLGFIYKVSGSDVSTGPAICISSKFPVMLMLGTTL